MQCWATHATDIRRVCADAGLHMLQILGEYVQCWATHATELGEYVQCWATHATDIRGVCAVLGYTCYRY